MEYFLIENYKKCINKLVLPNIDSIGCIFKIDPPHYSGNFWYAKTSYIRSLVSPDYSVNNCYKSSRRRHYASECWILQNYNKNRNLSIYQAPRGYNGYKRFLPRNLYENLFLF